MIRPACQYPYERRQPDGFGVEIIHPCLQAFLDEAGFCFTGVTHLSFLWIRRAVGLAHNERAR